VTFTIRLNNSRKRFAIILVTTVISSVFVWLIVANFIVRVAADTRMALTYEALMVAASRFPNSPRINFRLADTELADATSNGQFNTQAENHATRAVDLSPWDYRSRRLLALAQELNGKTEEAEYSLRAAVKLAPYHAELNWLYANLLLRRGKLNESLEPFRVAAISDLQILPTAIEMIWQSSGRNPDALRSFANNDAEILLDVVKFLTEQNLVAEAAAIFNTVDRQARINSPRGPDLVNTLIKAGQLEMAKNVWVEMVTALSSASSPRMDGNLIWNGGFESDEVKTLNHFDWIINPNQYARIVIDRNLARTGSRALKITFAGLDTTTLRDQVKQMLYIKPGTRYRLECYAKSSDLVTPEGPRVAIFGQGVPIAVSVPISAVSTDWQHLVVDFVAPMDTSSTYLHVVRIPRFSYDDPTRGIIWLDDFMLFEQ
jgi:tetratricopeptide (TPR) repeat protein